jgi:hypothetical protein
MALNSAGITAAIASISISGLTIKDVTSIPEKVNNRDCPILFPQPESWLDATWLDAQQGGEENSIRFGTPSCRYWQFKRTFNYVFLNNAVGVGRGNADNYASAVDKTESINEAMTAIDVSGVDVVSIGHNGIGVIQDPAGNKFTGCLFSITFRERINA